ncbi:uncharacterized protein CIMG_08541 [Coccidioides immitis RS]|uniref:FAD dependent oxidoreductase domain-containing protein n=3 Tax=Coccidioides immitis TaxID=5501 RepID=J3K5Q4_COCIM|nr:uncharacterized protein CIMG_08541 [Coccidioides immitis RS]EAS29795.3 hypothetical protein CIMG_08541 [Coccidioides immitis RS]KMU91605.1 D-amino acid oxidase [Coccidioides immitis H538.4]TPX22299.1 hypothetical protein DIZ76_014167 [Coccidioides immitis]
MERRPFSKTRSCPTSLPKEPLLISEDFFAGRETLHTATPSSPHILIIGGGVTGLTTAWLLLDRGYRVTIVSKEWATFGSEQRLTSQIAGALWELPPAGCGPQAVQEKLEMVQKWALESLKIYCKMTESEELAAAFGIKVTMCTSFHTNRIVDDVVKSKKMELVLGSKLEGFHWGMELLDKYGANVNSHGGLKDAYEHMAPIIDTDVAMSFLMRLVKSKGAQLHTDTIHGDLLDQERHLLRTYHADAIVNATGVMGSETASDNTVYHLRGAVLRVINDGTDFPRVNNAMLVSTESRADGNFKDMAFIVPRNDNILILGSITQPNQWRVDLTPESRDIQDMRKRCEDLLPVLKNARLDPKYPLAQGTRPYRMKNVRVEHETRKTGSGRPSKVVHAYGHGGAGWSLAFGSARQVGRLVDGVLRNKHAAENEIMARL